MLENACCVWPLLLQLVHLLFLGEQCFVVVHVLLLDLHLACPLRVDGGLGAEHFLRSQVAASLLLSTLRRAQDPSSACSVRTGYLLNQVLLATVPRSDRAYGGERLLLKRLDSHLLGRVGPLSIPDGISRSDTIKCSLFAIRLGGLLLHFELQFELVSGACCLTRTSPLDNERVILIVLLAHDFCLLTHRVPAVYLCADGPFVGVVLVEDLAEQVLVLLGRHHLILRVRGLCVHLVIHAVPPAPHLMGWIDRNRGARTH